MAITSTDKTLVGTHTFEAKACLTNVNPAVCTTNDLITFTITIVDPCNGATVSVTPAYTNINYSLGTAQTSTALTDPVPTNNIGTFCGTYTYVFSSTKHGNVLTTTTTDFTLDNNG